MSLTKDTAVTGIRKNKAGKVVAFNINRKVWGRGSRGGWLLQVREVVDSVEKQINMCCLGIYARACGVGVNRLRDNAMPASIPGRLPKSLNVFLEDSELYEGSVTNSNLAGKLAEYNDDRDLTDAEREERIIKGFASVGIRVKFVGKG